MIRERFTWNQMASRADAGSTWNIKWNRLLLLCSNSLGQLLVHPAAARLENIGQMLAQLAK
jgi:hypothetical protein